MLGLRAEMLSRTGRAEDALVIWQETLELDPESIGGHYMRAFLLARLGRRDEAIAEWEAVVAWVREGSYDEDVLWPAREIARLREA
jgi:tetratricopeptide (TPR) repeat protein